MNVVQVPRRFTRSHWGGTETYILEVSKRLVRNGHATSIVCANALAACDDEVIQDVPIRRVPYFYPYLGLRPETRRQLDLSGGSLFSFHMMRRLWTYPGLDLIHLHTGRRPGAMGRYVALKRGIPYVVSLHGGVFDVPTEERNLRHGVTAGALEWGKLLGWWVGSRRVLDDAAAVICVGQREHEETRRRFPHKRVIYMPNGVDAQRFAHGDGADFRRRWSIPEDARVVLTVGRIDPQKNQKMLVELMPRLREILPGAHLVVVGHVTNEGYYREMKALADGLPAGSVTIIPGLAGDSQELVDAYHAANCFVLPSIHEPFGIVLLEAWASHLPVVASRVGGIPGFVVDGTDGLLCEPHDRAGFLHAITLLLEDSAASTRMAECGRQKAVADYNWDSLTRQLIQLYEELVHENSLCT